MRGLGLVTALTIGCAAAPTANVAAPDPCACGGEGSVATAHLDADAALNAAIASDATIAAIDKDAAAACTEIDVDMRDALAKVDPKVLDAIDGARRVRLADKTIPLVERNFAAWSMYDAAVDNAREELAVAITTPLAEAIVSKARVTIALMAALDDVVGAKFAKGDPDAYLLVARARAPRLLPKAFSRAAVSCADRAVASARGRWVARFNGQD